MRLTTRIAATVATLFALGSAGIVRAGDGAKPAAADPRAVFERLKTLAGSWAGTAHAKDGPPAAVRWEVISGRTAVMETLFPGTEHEMRSVYHMDGPSLVMTHYCAAGNQPRMRLDPAASTADDLVFVFTGGTNLDAAKDGHIHGARIRILDADHLEEEWLIHQGGAETGKHLLFVARAR
jgi:hypothetical protein